MKGMILAMFLGIMMFGCSGNADKKSEDQADQAITQQEELIEEIEVATQEINEEVDELSGEIDSLLNNI